MADSSIKGMLVLSQMSADVSSRYRHLCDVSSGHQVSQADVDLDMADVKLIMSWSVLSVGAQQ